MTVLANLGRSMGAPAAETPRLLAPVRTAVIGLDRTGVLHAAALAAIPGCELVGLCDARSEARRAVRGLGFSAPAFEKPKRLFSKAHPEAVIVTGAGRAATARFALQHGAAVLVDRPLADSPAEAVELVRIAEEHGRPLAAAHPTLFHPVFAHTRTVLSSGALGTPKQVRTSMYVSRVFSPERQQALAPPGSAGGVLAQMASDLLVLLVQGLGVPATVRATGSALYGPFEDELHAMLTLPSGADVGLDCSWSVPGYPRPATVIEMEAEDGRLLASDDALEIELGSARDPSRTVRLGHSDLPQLARYDLDGEALYLMDASFLAWVSGASAPPHRAESLLDALRVMSAVYRSAAEGGRRLEVSA